MENVYIQNNKRKKNQELLETHNTENGCEYLLQPKVESFEKIK